MSVKGIAQAISQRMNLLRKWSHQTMTKTDFTIGIVVMFAGTSVIKLLLSPPFQDDDLKRYQCHTKISEWPGASLGERITMRTLSSDGELLQSWIHDQ